MYLLCLLVHSCQLQFVFSGLPQLLSTLMMDALGSCSPEVAKMSLHPTASIAMKRNTHTLQVRLICCCRQFY